MKIDHALVIGPYIFAQFWMEDEAGWYSEYKLKMKEVHSFGSNFKIMESSARVWDKDPWCPCSILPAYEHLFEIEED